MPNIIIQIQKYIYILRYFSHALIPLYKYSFPMTCDISEAGLEESSVMKFQVCCSMNLVFQFWETISEEHGVDEKGNYTGNEDVQLEKIDVYYNQSACKQN